MSRLSALAVLCSLMIAPPSAARLSASSWQSAAPMPDAARPSSLQGRATTPPPPAAPPPEILPGRSSNVRVELTISETLAGTTTTKNVVLITSNGSKGSIRSEMSAPGEPNILLDVDAHPLVLADGRVTLSLTFYYTPQRSAEAAAARGADIQEQMTVFLTDGKPLLISQSADPRGDRKVTVEVTATVMK
jgi:hypothetical protein